MIQRLIKPLSIATLGLSLTLSSAANSAPEPTPASSGESDEEERYSKAYDQMIKKLDAYLKEAKKDVWAVTSTIPKLQKQSDAAKWRVATALENLREHQAKLEEAKATGGQSGEVAKLEKKIRSERKRLSKDAAKLAAILERASGMRDDLATAREKLSTLNSDVAIEVDRFPENDHRNKRAHELVASAEWVLNKMEELEAACQADLSEPVTALFEQARDGAKS
jgi:chromosome segregation ATPase